MPWFEYIMQGEGTHLAYPIEQGNYGAVILLSRYLDIPVSVAVLSVTFCLAASSSAFAVRYGWRQLAFVARDPATVISFGIVVTFALSPLVWMHYYTLALIPILHLVLKKEGAPLTRALASISLFLSSGLLQLGCWRLDLPAIVPPLFAVSWVPLWVALLIEAGHADSLTGGREALKIGSSA